MAPLIPVVTAFRHPILSLGVQAVLTAHGSIATLADCSTFGGSLRAVRRHRPRVLVVGTCICEGRTGALEKLADASPGTRIALFCTRVGDLPEYARLEGASAVLPAEVNPDHLLDCIHALAAGHRWHAPPRTRLNGLRPSRSSQPPPRGVLAVLSARERQIAQAVATGRRNREIADAFGITPGTVKLHLNKIYAKVGVNSRLALLRKLVEEVGP